MADHAKAGRDVFQLLGDILAQWLELAAAGGASQGCRCMDLLVAWQVGRQGLALGRHARRSSLALRRAGGLTFVGLQVFQPQFQLGNLGVKLLRFAAELQALQLGDPQFQMVDLGRPRGQLLAQLGDDEVLLRQGRIALGNHGLESGDIVRKAGKRGHAAEFTQGRECLQVITPTAGAACARADASQCLRAASPTGPASTRRYLRQPAAR